MANSFSASRSLTLGFSPCPNDTFMFDALVNGKIDTEGLQFETVIADVEALNKKSIAGELDISKISFASFLLTKDYQLLNAGSALGRGVGPLLISKKEFRVADFKDEKLSVAIPGFQTTAHFLFSLFFPGATNKTEMVFSSVEQSVLDGNTDAGVIIHENRFTYVKKGLKKVCDLGELWEKETGQPVPLGGIVVRKNFPEALKQKIDRLVRRSVEYAFANPSSSATFVKQHAQEMEAGVRQKHIETYVNGYSIDLGETGRQAVGTFFKKVQQSGLAEPVARPLFVSSVAVTPEEETRK